MMVGLGLALTLASRGGGAEGPAFYVSKSTGTGSGDGTIDDPFRDLAELFAAVTLAPGDRVLFKRGDIWPLNSTTERLLPAQSGSAAGYITFGAYGSGVRPIFDGEHAFTLNGGVVACVLVGRTYIRLESLHFRWCDDGQNVDTGSGSPIQNTGRCVNMGSTTANDEVERFYQIHDCKFEEGESNVIRYCDEILYPHRCVNLTITDSEFIGGLNAAGCHTYTDAPAPTFSVTNCSFKWAGDICFGVTATVPKDSDPVVATFTSCTFEDNDGDTVSIAHSNDVVLIDRCMFRRTTTSSHTNNKVIGAPNTVTYRYCIFDWNGAPTGGDIYTPGGAGQHATFLNCTFYGGAVNRSANVYVATAGATTLTAKNCIFYRVQQAGHVSAASEFDTNCIFNDLGLANNFTQVSGRITSNPNLNSPSTDDFRVQPGSPALLAGINLGLSVDYAGNSIHPSTPTIGALEQSS